MVDQAHLLPPDVTDRLAAKSAALETRWGHQLGVVTVPTLGGHQIEDYGVRLGRYWGIGRRHIDDGVILLAAPAEHKVRIEVGYGLEAALKDEEADAILRHDVLPAFRRGEMARGVEIGTEDIIREVSVPASPKRHSV